jgi:hypothetical protein
MKARPSDSSRAPDPRSQQPRAALPPPTDRVCAPSTQQKHERGLYVKRHARSSVRLRLCSVCPWVLFELPLAGLRAEVVPLATVFGLASCGPLVHVHTANRVFCHVTSTTRRPTNLPHRGARVSGVAPGLAPSSPVDQKHGHRADPPDGKRDMRSQRQPAEPCCQDHGSQRGPSTFPDYVRRVKKPGRLRPAGARAPRNP